MGRRMAANLIAAGHRLAVWNRSADVAEDFAAGHDCAVVATPAALCTGAEAVVTMLADDSAARAVYLGPDGLIAAPGADLLVEMGTMSPDLIAEIAAAAEAAGKTFVDAPVSGATNAAEAATLLIMAGAGDTLAPRLSPIFDAMGKRTIWLGTTGSGAAMKLAVNMLIHGLNQNVAEALLLAERSGIALDRAYDVIENSAAAAPMLKFRRPIYLDESSHEVTFTTALAAKDVRLALDLAAKHGLSLPQTEVTKDMLDRAVQAGFHARDMGSIFNFMREQHS